MNTVRLEKIPASLKARNQWVLWRNVTRGGELSKLPFTTDGTPAKSNDPTTWTTFVNASNALSTGGGIGFVFSSEDEFCGIDFDGCRDPKTGTVSRWAKTWIVKLNSYSEVSPSGTGVKVFCIGKNPRDGGKKVSVQEPAVGGKSAGIEMYDQLRYFAVTGWKLAGLPAEPREAQLQIDELSNAFFPSQQSVTVPSAASSDASSRAAKYLERIPPAVSGQGGHNQTFNAACILVLGFGLSVDEAYPLLASWNQQCQPPWSEKELRHKLDDARKQPGERNYLRDANPFHWPRIEVPKYEAPKTDGITLHNAALSYLEQLTSGKKLLIELGIADLDTALGGGVAPGEMVVLAARSGHGKSAVALQCLDTASRNHLPSLMISEEMSSLSLGKRVIQFASETPEEHWKHSAESVRKDLEWHFEKRSAVYVVENCRTADKAAQSIRWYVEHKGVRVVAVDYAQILSSKGVNRYEQVTATSVCLRSIANETGALIIVLCQLSREIEKREKFIPKISDLKDSGQLEQDADTVVFLVWPHRIDSSRDPHVYQIYIAKNRNRPIMTPSFECRFLPSRQMILHESPRPQRQEAFDNWNNR